MIPYRFIYLIACVSLFLVSSFSSAQDATIPTGAPILRVQLSAPAKVKMGTLVRARTIGPLYDANRLIIPAGTTVLGKVVEVTPAPREKRVSAISHGDFTLLKEARIEFEELRFANGAEVPIASDPAEQSSSVVRFQSSTPKHESLVRQAWASVISRKDAAMDNVTAPGKGERIKKFMWSQLPWHPQQIDAGTQYDVTLAWVPNLPPQSSPEGAGQALQKHDPDKLNDSAILHAQLEEDLSSKTAKEDDPVEARVTQPLLDKQGRIEVPQGAVLKGRVLRARPAKKWGKNGALRFTFNQVEFAQGSKQQVSGVPTAMDGSSNQKLKLDAEGGVEPEKKSVLTPLALGLLATSALLDEDADIGHTATASNGFGIVTRIISISTGSKTVAGVIGMIATGRATYARYIARGHDVVFPRNSQIEVEVGPIQKPATTR